MCRHRRRRSRFTSFQPHQADQMTHAKYEAQLAEHNQGKGHIKQCPHSAACTDNMNTRSRVRRDQATQAASNEGCHSITVLLPHEVYHSCGVGCEQRREVIPQRLEVRALKHKVILITHSGGMTTYAEPLGTRDAYMAASINRKTTATRAKAEKQAVNTCWQCEMNKRWPRAPQQRTLKPPSICT